MIDPRDCFELPSWMVDSAWYANVPFVRHLMRQLRPRTVVELGVFYGMSYFCMNEFVRKNGLVCSLTGVDTWLGDEHAGTYSDNVYAMVNRHNHSEYLHQSTLLRMGFDDAADRFKDNSIDLLHIDGCHTYEAVSNDYNRWRPKVCRDGVVLFHDINILDRGFGVHRLWAEIRQELPTIQINVGPGLGAAFMNVDAGSQPEGAYDKMKRLGTMAILEDAGRCMEHAMSREMRVIRMKATLQRLDQKWWFRIGKKYLG